MGGLRCARCGVAVAGAAAPESRFCCAGCTLLARVPVDEKGAYPVNGALVWALATGFLLFNQLMLGGAALWMIAKGKAVLSDRMIWASLGAGVLVWVLAAVAQWLAGARKVRDFLVAVVSIALVGTGFVLKSPGAAIAGNMILIAWNLRGVARPASGGKKPVDGG